jgi:glycosyltransferase involved in cell wall biosynthesis
VQNKILLVGTVSNVAKTIEKELKIVKKAFGSFDKIEIFLVESDSTDNTVEILKSLQQRDKNFSFITMGKLSYKYPNRIARIAYCRNVYVNFIKENFGKKCWQYVVVADLDGMNKKLRRKAINSCFEINIKWDGMMANQKFGYYDIYALRAKNWVEMDCFLELQNLKNSNKIPNVYQNRIINFVSNFNHFDNLREIAIFKKMKVISRKSPLIEVESAFGGLAIYKANVFLNSNYDSSNNEESEHVAFHRKLTNIGFSFYINPNLINNNFNSYNISKLKVIRFLRELRKNC